ncbi:MAG: hypothetical protein MUO35_00070 [Anaerolineales bacterium]|nr:hypothetical protein [Anaerolineales bacterium]
MCPTWQDEPRVGVEHDARVFGASVLLNLTGYDEENGPAFHPVRARLREETRAAVPRALIAECTGFRDAHPLHGSAYMWLAMLTDGPPCFDLVHVETAAASPIPMIEEHVRHIAHELAGLRELLRKLWDLAAVRNAYEGTRPEVLAHGEAHARILEPNVAEAIAYMRTDPAALLARYTLIPNLLSSYWQAMGIPIGMHFHEVRGPVTAVPGAPDPHATGDPHEFVHMLVAPTSWDPSRVDAHASRLDGLFRRAQGYDAARYDSFILFMNECLVDAVSCRVRQGPVPLASLDDPNRPQVMEDARAGLLMAPWFYEHLETYERRTASFAEWFDETMAAATTEGVVEHLARFGVIVRDVQ